MSETLLQAQIVRTLRAAGIWVIRTQVKGRHSRRSVATGEPGMPDLYLPGLGHLEVKYGEKSKCSDEQVAWIARARDAGINVAVVRSVSDAIRIVALWRRRAA